MELIKRINLKLFIPLSVISTLLFALFSKSWTEVIVLLSVYAATLVNLYMLMWIIAALILNEEVRLTGKVDVFKVVMFFFLKVFIVFGALSLGVHFIGNKIIIALINYVVQIFVLGISMRHNLK